MSSPLLSQAMLRDQGYERHLAAGFVNILSVSVQNGVFTMMASRWDIYERGILGRDPDAEAIGILVLEEVLSQRLHNLQADPFDLVTRAKMRLADQSGCVATAMAIDLGGSSGGGEGYLLGDAIRNELGGAFALRTVSDADLPRPVYDSAHFAYKLSPEALTGALAARAASRQVLISDDATIEARRILTDALRQAGSVSARAAPPLTRLIAWTSEIVMRPLISPLVDTDAGARLRDARTTISNMRIMR